jgi:hypothetical protein
MLSRSQGQSAAGRITSIEKSNALIGNRTRDPLENGINSKSKPAHKCRDKYILMGSDVRDYWVFDYAHRPVF